MKFHLGIGLLAGIGLALIATGCEKRGTGLVVSGRVEIDDIHIGSKIGGRVWKVLAEEGDEVKAGAPIILLDERELTAQINQSKSQAAQAQAQLDLLLAGSRKEDIEQAQALVEGRMAELQMRLKGFREQEVREAQAQLAAATSEMELARKNLTRSEELASSDTISKQELDTRRTAFRNAQAQMRAAQQRARLFESGSRPEETAAARAQLAQAEADLEKLIRGARPEEIAAARAVAEAAKANVARLESQMDEMRIVTPQDAVVETLDLHPGDLIKPGETVAVLNLKNEPYVRAYVPENRLGLVRPAMEVGITVDTFPGRTFKGKVRHINTEAEFTPRNVQTTEKRAEQVFEMKVDVVDGGGVVRPGMYADVHINGGEVGIVGDMAGGIAKP